MFKLLNVIKHAFRFLHRIHLEGKLLEIPSLSVDALPHVCNTTMRLKPCSRLTIFLSKPSFTWNHHARIIACFAVVQSGTPP
jgi:hypothetical protein